MQASFKMAPGQEKPKSNISVVLLAGVGLNCLALLLLIVALSTLGWAYTNVYGGFRSHYGLWVLCYEWTAIEGLLKECSGYDYHTKGPTMGQRYLPAWFTATRGLMIVSVICLCAALLVSLVQCTPLLATDKWKGRTAKTIAFGGITLAAIFTLSGCAVYGYNMHAWFDYNFNMEIWGNRTGQLSFSFVLALVASGFCWIAAPLLGADLVQDMRAS